MNAFYLRDVSFEAVASEMEQSWPCLPAEVVRTEGSPWIEVRGVNAWWESAAVVAKSLSQALECELVHLDSEHGWEAHTVRRGRSIRWLQEDAKSSKWGIVKGEPEPWEATIGITPELGADASSLDPEQATEIVRSAFDLPQANVAPAESRTLVAREGGRAAHRWGWAVMAAGFAAVLVPIGLQNDWIVAGLVGGGALLVLGALMVVGWGDPSVKNCPPVVRH